MPHSDLSRTDPGRALFSFAQIQHVLRVEFGRAQRYRYPLACLVLAIDQLGTIRDLAGYDAKERVVEGVIALLEQATRSSDFLGRTADDRLIAVIPHTTPDGARALAERLIEGVRGLEPAGSPTAVSLSVGGCTNADPAVMYFDALLGAAQAALDEAIGAGGDRFVERTPQSPG